MKILVLCDQGNNRSVTLAHQLKYLKDAAGQTHDVLTAGTKTNGYDTLIMLQDWADKVIVVDQFQMQPGHYLEKTELWNLGADVYPRPHNKELLAKVKQVIADHREELS